KLIFAKDSIEDGYLHTYEIFGQNLNADLAVLSACNSGNGKLVSGEGVLSMAHAFTHAGCPSILMTKWEVDEKSTAQIIENFYDNLKAGQHKSEALRNAKLDFLANAPLQLQDPYYWAGLVIIGSDEPLFGGNWVLRYWWVGLLIVGIGYFLYKVRRKA
ncbi:MAG: CHAT domain-containing protein, partial [Saprospiraceae bacterium]|nr:CHAT domain-containing protein [Saprospiraceae bacterium]